MEAKRGAAYTVERIVFDEFARGELEGEPKAAAVFSGTWEQCMRYWEQFASGLQDAEGPAENQSYSRGIFWRIIGE